MARYIDAEKLKEAFGADTQHIRDWDVDLYDLFMDEIDEQPTADVQEIKHGKWECCNVDENVYMCDGKDGCGATIQMLEGTPDDNNFKWCPNCGAKMDKER